MNTVSDETIRRIELLFSEENRIDAEQMLIESCGNNLHYLQTFEPTEWERFQFAALKLSGGSLERLRRAIHLAETDWRDLLVAADFAENVTAHLRWLPDF